MTRNATPYPTEAQEQKTVIAYFSHSWIGQYLIHIPNGGSRSSAAEGANLKAMGVKAGVSDLFVALPKHYDDGTIKYCGLWIELKRCQAYYKTDNAAYRAVTTAQKEWFALMCLRGKYQCYFCYGADQAIRVIDAYAGTSPM